MSEMLWHSKKNEVEDWLESKMLAFTQAEITGSWLSVEKWVDEYIYLDIHEIFFTEFPIVLHEWLSRSARRQTNFERNNINILESVQKTDNQDRDTQQERGHALMASTSKPNSLLIESGASNHMMEIKYSFSSVDTDKIISIHMGDDSTIISKGKGTVNLEHGSFFYVLYVPSLASNLLSVYKMTHIGVPKRVTFSPNDV